MDKRAGDTKGIRIMRKEVTTMRETTGIEEARKAYKEAVAQAWKAHKAYEEAQRRELNG